MRWVYCTMSRRLCTFLDPYRFNRWGRPVKPQSVWHLPNYWPPPHPLSTQRVCPPPAPKVHTRRAVRGWWVSSSEDARHWIGLLQYYSSTCKTLHHLRQISWDPAGVCGRFSDCDAPSHPGAIWPGGGGQGLCTAAGQLGHSCQQAAAQASQGTSFLTRVQIREQGCGFHFG